MININTAFPVYMTYGEKDNKHQLIHSSNPKVKPPSQLLSVTDKPTGHLSADVIWYPVIGCEVFDNLWCVWCTYPDDKAFRGGMVRSKVALIPVEDAIEINDLTNILKSITEIDKLPFISAEQLESVFRSLIIESKPVLILEDLMLFSTVINELWKGLWPRARRDLNCRVKLNPPQSLTPSDEFEVVTSIKSRELQWKFPHTVVDLHNLSDNVSDRAAKFIVYRNDSILEDLLKTTLALDGPPLKRLKKLSRTADLIDSLTKNPSSHLAISLIKHSLSFEDTENDLATYINSAIEYLSNHLEDMSFSEVKTLRNLIFKKNHNAEKLSISLEGYIKSKFTSLASNEKHDLISKAMIKENNWWYKSLKSGIEKGIDSLDIDWLEQAIKLIINKESFSLAREVISLEIENELLNLLLKKEYTREEVKQLRGFSNIRRWSRINAWCAYKLEEAMSAFVEVLVFQNNNIAGFKYLSELYGTKESLIVFRGSDDSRILEYLISTNELIEDLLQYLDLEEKIDKYILSIAYNNGISIPKETVSDMELDKILHSASNGEKVYGLIASIADSEFKFNLAERTLCKLRKGFEWERLTNNDSNMLLNILSRYIIENDINNLEDEYVQKIIKTKYLNSKVAPKIVNFLINWKADLSESEVMTILHYYTDNDWNSYGKILGEYINSRKWKKLSLTLYELRKSKPLSNEALMQCYKLLPQIKKCNYLFSSKNNTGEIPDSFILSKLAEVCANLDDSESLKIMWENAGGKTRHLSSKGTHGEQWNKAIRKASKGKLEGGLTTLVDIILEEYPNNKELKYFKSLIDDRNM